MTTTEPPLPVTAFSPVTTSALDEDTTPVATLAPVEPAEDVPVSVITTVITNFLDGTSPPATSGDVPIAPGDSPIEAALLAFARRQTSSESPIVTNAAVDPLITTQASTTTVSGNPLASAVTSALSLAVPLLGPNASSLAVPLQLLYQIPVIGPVLRAGVALLVGPIEALSRIPLVGPVIRAVAVAVGLLPTHNPQVNAEDFTSAAQLRAWHEQLDALGLRATGSPAQEQYIDDLIGMLQGAGLAPENITTQDVEFQRWSLDHWALTVTDANGTVTQVNAPAYIPYSGVTDEEGITRQLVYISDVENIRREDVEGKIVVFDVPLTEIPEPLFLALQYPGKIYDPNSEILLPLTDTYKRPYLNGVLPAINQLQDLGAAGVVGVLDYPEEAVTGSYFPFDGVLRNLPGVYVDREVGDQLKAQAQQGVSATIVMPATVETVTTRNIVAVIPGKNYGTTADEIVMIHSHTDGTNGLEDNGPYIAVAMAEALNRIPQEQRDATYTVLLSTGHFAGGIGIDAFANDPRNADLIAKTKVAITIEHVGALEYTEVDGHMVPTGRYEPGVWWSRDDAGIIDGAYNQLVQADQGPGGVLLPLYDLIGGSPDAPGVPWPGDGGYLDAAGITDVNYITGPTYLLNYGVDTVDRVDFDRVRSAAIAMTDQALYYGRTSKHDLLASKGLLGLGPVGALYSTGILGKIIGSLGLF